jgi:hypothetical protein
MIEFMKRPRAVFSPGDGLLRNEHFQICYVTNDIARACYIFRDRFGIREFKNSRAGSRPAATFVSNWHGWRYHVRTRNCQRARIGVFTPSGYR